MWSGPRNLSTTMMRSFGARPDTRCVDEPFYAAYLALTGLEHPMRSHILSAHDTDARRVAGALVRELPEGEVLYQKHMAHHMVEGIPREWMAQVSHVFLVRHPARVIVSYARKSGGASLQAIGFPLQIELFEEATRLSGQTPLVLDSDELLAHPERSLAHLCRALDLPFLNAMLSWKGGRHAEDGVWGAHWYDAVWRSTGFGPPSGPLPEVSDEFKTLLDSALPYYRHLLEEGRNPLS